jgi:nitric oxide reductase subunit C
MTGMKPAKKSLFGSCLRVYARMTHFSILLLLTLFLMACSGAPVGSAAAATPELSAQAKQGQAVFSHECGSCHSLIEDTIIVGPSLAGVATRAAMRLPDVDAQTYIMTSILRPGDYVVTGFENLMPENLAKKLTGEEIDAVVAYLLTLK